MRRPYVTGSLLFSAGLLRIYISSLERTFLFSTLNIVAIALVILGASLLAYGLARGLASLFRSLWTSLGG